MMVRSTPSTRIGEAERAEAQRALQAHLNAGRLHVAEFVERFAGAAGAVTAADIAALFADLPAPHPKLPGAHLGRTRRSLVIVGAVAVLALVGSLGFVIGREQTTPAPSSTAAAAPMPSVSPTESAAKSSDPLPDDAMVRRSTGPGLITLRPSYGVDLDDVASPTWNIGTGCCGRDVGFGSDASQLAIDGGHAPATGPLEFATCFHETAYTDSPIERGSLQLGDTLCVRTKGHRLALITVVNASEQAVEFGATVWDPPVPS
jgi:Domain of unknown function (DUF1707)